MDPSNQQNWSSQLLIGGRRAGKTTLLQRVLWELDAEGDRRCRLQFTCLTVPEHRGQALMRWFFLQLKEKFKSLGEKLSINWTDTGNAREGAVAAEKVKSLLLAQKRRRGGKTILLFDETQHLVDRDAPDYPVFRFLRELVQEDLITLIATTYPHGAGRTQSLRILTMDERSELYNTFAHTPEIGPWSPEETWDFLYEKLDGFGVILPSNLRQSMLSVSRGIPWIAQTIGIELCGSDPPREQRRLVKPTEWEQVRRLVLKEIGDTLRTTVNNPARAADDRAGVWPDRHPERCLGGGRLWGALCRLAQRDVGDTELIHNNWPTPLRIHADQIHQEPTPLVSRDVLLGALHEITHTSVLTGLQDRDQEFEFSNNLLPVWLRETDR